MDDYYRTVRLPDEVLDSEIVEEVTQVAFRAIQDRLATLGYPVEGGDVAPWEVGYIERAIENLVCQTATNNGEIAMLNEGRGDSGYETFDEARGRAGTRAPVLGIGDAEIPPGTRTLTVVYDVSEFAEHEIENLEFEAVVQAERTKDEWPRDDGKPGGHPSGRILATRVFPPLSEAVETTAE